MKVKISANAYYLPETVESTETLQNDNPDWDMPKILSKTGVFKRVISGQDQTAVDMAYEAAKKLFQDKDNYESIDLLVLVTQSPDYVLPTSACILQDKLGLSKKCMAFDVNLGCSGFVYALSIVGSLIESGVANTGLILCADTYSKYIDKNDRTCRPLFSDGASATMIERSESDNFGSFELGTDGSGYKHLIVKNSGSRIDDEVSNQKRGSLEMHGSDVFLFTMNTVPQCITNLLKRSSYSLDDIDMFVFHQASRLVIENIVRLMSLDVDKVFTNFENIGNTVSASIPIALKDADSQGRLKEGDIVMLVGFGVGLSWGATIIKWTAQ